MSDNMNMPARREDGHLPPPPPLPDPTMGYIDVTITMKVMVNHEYTREDAVQDLRHLKEQINIMDENATFNTTLSDNLKEIII